MAAPRALQFIALRNLSCSSRCTSNQIRNLHMTAPATYASPTLVKDTQRERPKTTQASRPLQTPTRHFNTSHTLKAVGDTSTIDFMYLPADLHPTDPEIYRVPILPTNDADTHQYGLPEDASEVGQDSAVMKPEISTMSADAVFQPMAELSDGHAMDIDFHAMADRVAAGVRQVGKMEGMKDLSEEDQAGIMKRIWGDIVDDMLGLGKKKSA